MALSLELQCLLAAIRMILIDAPTDTFQQLLFHPRLNPNRLEKLAGYHQLRPILFEAMHRIGYKGNLYDSLKSFSRHQALKNIFDSRETERLLRLLSNNNIPVLPYKGTLFWEKLYQKQNLRESADIDLIVPPAHAIEALQVLLTDGYRLVIEEQNPDKILLEDIVRSVPIREISLVKNDRGYTYQLDFHWAITEAYQSYPIDLNSFFQNALQQEDFLIPSPTDIGKLLLTHHGARGCWLKLKELADWYQFQQVVGDKGSFASALGMHKVATLGNHLIEQLFLEQDNSAKIPPTLIDFWENALLIEALIPKIKYTHLQKSMLDQAVSWNQYLYQRLVYYATINPFERKRLFVFPPDYIWLNAFGKLITYLWSRVSK